VLDALQQLQLVFEERRDARVSREVIVHALDDDAAGAVTLHGRVREPDLAHATDPELSFQLVVAELKACLERTIHAKLRA
jgi:hypothetical protein